MSNYDSIIDGSSIKTLDYYNVINIAYAWDYENSDYSKSYTYPQSDALNPSFQALGEKREVQLNFPAIYNDVQAKAWALRYYYFWAFGVTYGTQESTLNLLGSTTFTLDSGQSSLSDITMKANRVDVVLGKKNRVILSGYHFKQDVYNVWP